MLSLSKRQQSILDFIKDEVKTKGYPPSVREIGDAVGLASSSTVHGHLQRLEEKGYIRRNPTKPRAIELVKSERDHVESMVSLHTVQVPVIGKVAAGEPITAMENIEEYFPVPETMVGSEEVFILNVQGESMIEAGILDGDKVIVRQQSTAYNGEIIVALTEDNEATVKRFYKEDGHFRLQPENSAMAPIILSNVSIVGKVIGLFRDVH